jgi:urease accessory protein
VRACAELVVSAGLDIHALQRMRWTTSPPVVLRRTGPARVHLVAAAGGPLGGDELELRIRVGEGAELTVGSAGATVAQPGRPGGGPSRWTVVADLAPGATLRWAPEPTVVCDGAELHASMRVRVAEGARALVREEVWLGRHGQLGGRFRGALAVDHAGQALLRHTTVLDGADPGLCGPAGTDGGRVVTTLVGAGDEPAPDGPATGEREDVRWARHQLAGPGWLLVSVGSSPLVPSVVSEPMVAPAADLAGWEHPQPAGVGTPAAAP